MARKPILSGQSIMRQIVEIGRVIDEHYQLQRLVKQGQVCTLYQGVDVKLQRVVMIKVVPAAYVPAYKAAMRLTSQFSSPSIVILYDLVLEADTLYLVQEYVEGDDFSSLLLSSPQPYEVANIGRQICAALLYAGGPGRRVCHGDLTPAAILRDSRGKIRVNNFALPGDLHYFTAWSTLGGEGTPLSDRNLPWGVESEQRRADDTRAVGLLLYQLLTSRQAGVTTVEPPADGQLRFARYVPPELCEVVARTLIRRYPRPIATPQALHDELKVLAQTLAPSVVPGVVSTPAIQQAEGPIVPQPRQFLPGGLGTLANTVPGAPPVPVSGYRPYPAENTPGLAVTAVEGPASEQTIADLSLVTPSMTPSMNAGTARQSLYPQTETTPPVQHSSVLIPLMIGLIVFVVLFIVGYLAASFLLHP